MKYVGIGYEMFRVDWCRDPFCYTLPIAIDSKIIGFTFGKPERDRDGDETQDMWVYYLRGSSGDTGIDVMLYDGTTFDVIDGAVWEHAFTVYRKSKVVHLFRKLNPT